MNPSLNQKLDELRAELEESGATPQYTKVIKAGGTAKALPTATVKAGETPEYSDEGEEMNTDEPKSAKASPIPTKVVKASGSAKGLPTPSQSKPPSSKPGGLAGEDFRRLAGLPKLDEVSSKTIAGWHADEKAKMKGGNEKAKEALRDAEKNLKATIASFEALKRAEPDLKDIIETYTVAHLKDWISGPSQGSIRMLWAELRDIEQRNAED